MTPAFPFRIQTSLAAGLLIIDQAFSREHADQKAKKLRAQNPDQAIDVVPNELIAQPEAASSGELADLRAWRQSVIDNTGTDDPHLMAKAFRAWENQVQVHERLKKREEALIARIIALADPPPMPPPAPIDFSINDYVQCKHSDRVVLVTGITAKAFTVLHEVSGEVSDVPRSCGGDYRRLNKDDAKPYIAAAAKDKKAREAIAAGKIDALAAPSPEFPFGVGDVVANPYTPHLVKVTAVGPDSTRGGFDWVHTDPQAAEQSGSVPLNAVGNFTLHGARVSQKKNP